MILQFLRGDAIDAKRVSECEMAAFADDVDYYGLPVQSVVEWLGRRLCPLQERFSSEDHTHDISVSDEGLLATRQRNYRYACVSGDNWYSGQDHVVITICLEYVKGWLMLGVIDQRPTTSNSAEDTSCYGFSTSSSDRGGRADSTESKRRAYADTKAKPGHSFSAPIYLSSEHLSEHLVSIYCVCVSTAPLPFATGDTIELEVDCAHSKLTVCNTTRNLGKTMELLAGQQWRVHVCMFDFEKRIRILHTKTIF